MDLIQETLDDLNIVLNELLLNPYVSSALTLFIVLYAGLAAPDLPPVIAQLFDYPLFKILILSLILFVNNYNSQVALLTAVAFFISLQTLSRYKIQGLANQISRIRGATAAKEEEQAKPDEAIGEEGEIGYGLGVSDEGGETQVSGLASRTQYYDGPQGMKHPVGYAGPYEGAAYN